MAARARPRLEPVPPARPPSIDDLRRVVVDAETVARVLPRAITLRTNADRELHAAAEPMVAHALREVVRKDPEQLADALFPIVGRAVRKAVSAAFAAITERITELMEHTFTVQGLRFRLEAARSGRPLPEVILSHSTLFRVEHVFLLHRPTGLLLASASGTSNPEIDHEPVAAMLSVIDGFVRETFAEREPITRFEVGELTGFVDYAPGAMLVMLVRGAPSPELSTLSREAVEKVQSEYRDELQRFRGGSVDPFAPCQPTLDALLVSRRRPKKRSLLPAVAFVTLVAVIALIVFARVHASHLADAALRAEVATLAGEAGIVVTSATRDGDKFSISGLRDPLARDPSLVLAAHDLSHTSLSFQPFFSTDPRLAEARVKSSLTPPPSVKLWVAESPRGGVVHVAGVASREWLDRVRFGAPFVPGISAVDLREARESDAIATVAEMVKVTEGTTFHFKVGSAAVDPTDAQTLDNLAAHLRTLLANAPRAGVTPSVSFVGHSDPTGEDPNNRALSQDRADAVIAELRARDVPASLLVAHGLGAVDKETSKAAADGGRNVRVSVAIERGAQ